jgi:ABC-type Zn uptake system ZnuABC Zn-binding protein ZnuA
MLENHAMFERRMRIVVLALLLTLLANSTAPAVAQTPETGDEPLNVVASFSILGDLVENVGGDRVDTVTIVGAGVDAHTFDPSPDDVASIADAALVFEIGIGFETWLDDMYAASGSEANRVVVTEGLDLIRATEEDHEHEAEEADEASPAAEDDHEHDHEAEGSPAAEHESDGEADHAHGEFDPHVWHDVTNAMLMVEIIRDALIATDPAHAEIYEANAAAYLVELRELDDFIFEHVAALPEERRRLVTSHDTFGYFARRYDFEVVGTALGSLSTEAGDPSAEEVSELVVEIQATGVPAIFAENVSNPDLMAGIAAEAGVELVPTLYTDALGEPGSEGDTYVGMMRYNVTAIASALGQ